METIVERLGRFAADLTLDKIPREVIEKGKTCMLNGIGIGLSCYNMDTSKAARSLIKQYEKAAEKGGTLLGDGNKASLMGAAFANGVMFHSRGQEDTHGTMHIGTTVIPTALSLAEWQRSSGREVLTAIIAGYEIAAAIGKEFTALTTPRGFRASPIYGIFGSATATGKLLRLNPQQMANALSYAAAYAFGTLEPFLTGTMEIFFENGLANRNGIMAALIAQTGMSGAATAMEGPFGFCQAFTNQRENPDRIGADLGQKWEILNVFFKPYATCAFNQSPVTAIINLIKKHDLKAEQVERIHIRMNAYEANYPGIKYTGPFSTFLQTIMSTAFGMGVPILERKLLFSDLWRFEDEGINKLCRLTTVEADDQLPPLNVVLTVQLKSGQTLQEDLRVSPNYYFYNYDQDVELITGIHQEMKVPKHVTENLINQVREVEAWKSVDQFVRSLTFKPKTQPRAKRTTPKKRKKRAK